MTSFLEIDSRKITKYIFLYFLVIFLANFFFKMIHLDFSSLWYDEVISIKSAQQDFGHIKHVSEWDKNPPFYYYCLWVWIKLFGNSVFAVRLLSVFFSSLAASVLFVFSNRFFNFKTAIFASLFFISSNILFFYSHETRAYSLGVLLTLLSAHVFLSALQTGKTYLFLLLGLLNFLLIYTHYILGLVCFFEGLMIIVLYRQHFKNFSLSILITAGLILLRFTKKQFQLILDFNSGQQVFWLKRSDLNYLKEVSREFFSHVPYLALAALLFYAISIVMILAFYKKVKSPALLLSLLTGPGSILLLFVLGKYTPIFLDRYLLFSVPFLLIVPAYCLSFIKLQPPAFLLAAAFTALSIFKMDLYTVKPMDYKNAMVFIKNAKDDNTAVIASTTDISPLFSYYYDRKIFNQENAVNLLKAKHIFFVNTSADLPPNLSDFHKLIYVGSFQEYIDGSAQKEVDSKFVAYNTVNAYQGVQIREYLNRVKLR